jgi:hypothetical protein
VIASAATSSRDFCDRPILLVLGKISWTFKLERAGYHSEFIRLFQFVAIDLVTQKDIIHCGYAPPRKLHFTG